MAEWTREVAIAKVDAPERMAWGWLTKVVNTDGTPVVDRQGDIIPVDELVKAVKRFMRESRAGDFMHDGKVSGQVLFADLSTPELRAARDPHYPNTDQSVGVWIGMECSPELFAKVEAGEVKAFSIGGTAEISEAD